MSLEFEGKDRLVERLNHAISGDCPHTITTCLRKALCESIADEQIRLPDEVFEPVAEHYARREVFHCPEKGYAVIAMTWGPGQGTPIHDHGGMWCVEGVWSGCIEVCQYQLLDERGEDFHFEPVGSIVAGCGSAGSLIPPHEYHTIRNPDEEHVAVSVHIYSGPMTECAVFNEGATSGWFVREKKSLSLDA